MALGEAFDIEQFAEKEERLQRAERAARAAHVDPTAQGDTITLTVSAAQYVRQYTQHSVQVRSPEGAWTSRLPVDTISCRSLRETFVLMCERFGNDRVRLVKHDYVERMTPVPAADVKLETMLVE